MKFFVYSRAKAKKASYKINEPTLIISITDPAKTPNVFAKNSNIVSICRVSFDDTDPDILINGEVLMTQSDANKIKDFIMAYKNKVETIIVHCEAGISRSAGICAAIQKYLTGDDSAIFDSHYFCPNMHCYRLMLNALFDVPNKSIFEE
jgi:protein-tyrosine phosphatase